MRLQTIPSHADAGARACAIALGFSIPISVALDNVLLGLIFICWLASAAYRDKLGVVLHNRVAAASLGLFCLFVAGLAWTQASSHEGVHMLGKYVDLAFVPIFATLFARERDRRLAWLALAAALAITVVLSYLIWFGIVGATPFTLGTAQNPEVFKRYLTQSVFLAFGACVFAHLALQAQSRTPRRAWTALAMLAAINVLALTQGRTGQLIVLALAVHFAYAKWRWKGAAGAAALVALVLAITVAFNGASRLTTTPDELQSWSPAQAASTSTGLRLEFYRNSLEIARAHPWFGTGTGSFATVYAAHVAGGALAATVNPHDEYLNITVQLGVLGLAAMLYLFYCEWRLAPALPTAHERELARALVITFALGCAFNSLLMDHAEGLLFAWASGLLFAGLRSPIHSKGQAR